MPLKQAILFLAISFLFSESSRASSGFSKPEMNIELTAFSLKEVAMMSRGTATTIDSTIKYQINESLKLSLWPVASFSSGQQASRDQLNPLTNLIYLKEASVEKKWNEFLSFKMGALYQKEYLIGMSGQAKAFPAVALNIPAKRSESSMELKLQAAVPTSAGLATTSSELETNATLFSGTFKISTKWTEDFKTNLSYAHYVFNRLSSASASEAYLRGNSVSKLGPSSFAFVYQYAGDEVNADMDWSIGGRVGLLVKLGYLKNSQAPEGLNTGIFVGASPFIKVSDKEKVGFKINYFRVESDAAVAVFSDPSIGRANREGQKFALSFGENEVEWLGYYAYSKLIDKNPNQSDDEMFAISFTLSGLHF